VVNRNSATTDINASLETVWSLVADPAAYSSFDPTTARVMGPPADIGVRLKVYSTVTGDLAWPVRVTTYAPPRRMVWRGGTIFGLTKGVRTFALDPLEGNRTRFTLSEEWSGPLLWMRRKPPDMTESFASFCRGLKELAEAMTAAKADRRRKG
jgi:hypothetical protein